MTNLKSCPFCGGSDITPTFSLNNDMVRKRFVSMECHCGAQGPAHQCGTEDDYILDSEAITAARSLWNERAQLEAKAEKV